MVQELNKKTLQLVILAGGKGTRMKSALPKPMVSILGKPILSHIFSVIADLSSQVSCEVKMGVVVGYQKEVIEGFLKENDLNVETAWQKEQKGTAHALQTYFEENPDAWESDYLGVICGDTPLLESIDLVKMINTLSSDDLEGVCASFLTHDPKGLGRIIKSTHGAGFKIVEEKDADDEQRKIKEVNSGLYFLKTSFVKEELKKIDSKNAASEFYLTDLFKMDKKVKAITFEDEHNFLGINDLSQLEIAEDILQKRKIKNLQNEGVRFIKPETSYIEQDVEIGEGTIIYPHVILQGQTAIGRNSIIESSVVIKDSTIESDVEIYASSYLEDSHIGENCKIGPMARIRPGSDFHSHVKVGNFVETKKSTLKEGAKVSHLSYVGDAEIGENSNIGCGFITCNYDGANKHKTKIGKNTFIGSDCQMIAPVEIGDEAFVAAGSTITSDVPDGAFAIARGKQVTKVDMAKRFLKKK